MGFVGGKVEPDEIDAYDFCPADEAILKEIKERSMDTGCLAGHET